MARQGRGQLSGIERLPAEATPIIAWANDELRRREAGRTQTEIYQEFHTKLEALQREHRGELEFTIPSFQAFNRHSIKLATLARRIDDTRAITGVLAEKFDAKASDDLTIIAAETIKTLVLETLAAAGEADLDPKGTLNLASALFRATQAQGISTARRAKVEAEFKKNVERAIDDVARSKGMTAETVEAIKDKILSVQKK